ncbi:MAG: hypothetical protein EOP09_01240 [Proteobacteria bacterium]|nr:MAG: hypothetical protein EOP09_01240 [Pseudomonadota bacterium]
MLTALLFGVLVIVQQSGIAYSSRNGYAEGLKLPSVSGADIDVLSCTWGVFPNINPVPSQIGLKFVLPEGGTPFIVVREIRNRKYYWLDDVKRPWKAGSTNSFLWSTQRVLRYVPEVDVRGLGMVVRLNDERPLSQEKLIPALPQPAQPGQKKVTLYLRTPRPASLEYSIEVNGQTFRGRIPDSGFFPFRIVLPPLPQTRKWYVLRLTGRFLDDPGKIVKTISIFSALPEK